MARFSIIITLALYQSDAMAYCPTTTTTTTCRTATARYATNRCTNVLDKSRRQMAKDLPSWAWKSLEGQVEQEPVKLDNELYVNVNIKDDGRGVVISDIDTSFSYEELNLTRRPKRKNTLRITTGQDFVDT